MKDNKQFVLRKEFWRKWCISLTKKIESGGKIKDKVKKYCPQKVWNILKVSYDFVRKNFGRVQIPYMVVSVGQACNLKCRDCANFAPLAPIEWMKYSVNEICNDFQNMFSRRIKIGTVQIQGGEPFIYSELEKLLVFLGKQKNIGNILNITIATNGKLIPNDKILDTISQYDVFVRISRYEVCDNLATNLYNKCLGKHIRCEFYDFASKKTLWYLCGGIEIERETNNEVVEQRYQNCDFRGCLTLERGELSYCSRATNSFRIQGFERKKDDYFNVRDKFSYRLLRKFVNKRHYMEACRYCNGTDTDKMVSPAIQR